MGKGSDSNFILSRVDDVRATEDEAEVSAPIKIKSRPTTPMRVSWPAAEEVTAAGHQQRTAARSERRRMLAMLAAAVAG